MEQKKREKSLKERIRSGQICRQDVTRRLAELAFAEPMTVCVWRWRMIQSWTSWICRC